MFLQNWDALHGNRDRVDRAQAFDQGKVRALLGAIAHRGNEAV